MQPSNDGFQPRWRQFHPQSTVWVQNILDHDVIFQVADEYDNPYQYKLPSGKVSELPGGAVATLGVKAIVDELIQNNKDDVLRIWDKDVRAKHEEAVILRVKEATISGRPSIDPEFNIDLSVDKDANVEDEPIEQEEVEEAFPEAKKSESKNQVASIGAASVAGKKNSVIESD